MEAAVPAGADFIQAEILADRFERHEVNKPDYRHCPLLARIMPCEHDGKQN
jgi:hypothetical protein